MNACELAKSELWYRVPYEYSDRLAALDRPPRCRAFPLDWTAARHVSLLGQFRFLRE